VERLAGARVLAALGRLAPLFLRNTFRTPILLFWDIFLIHDLILYPITDVNNYKIYNYDSTSLEAWLNQ
jgi:hypothetical protein